MSPFIPKTKCHPPFLCWTQLSQTLQGTLPSNDIIEAKGAFIMLPFTVESLEINNKT